jgi:hypothetical protein
MQNNELCPTLEQLERFKQDMLAAEVIKEACEILNRMQNRGGE